MHRPQRSLLAAVFAVVVLAAGPAIAGTRLAGEVCGDVNESGTVTSADALAVLKSAVGEPIPLSCNAAPGVGVYGIVSELPETSGHTPDFLLGSAVTIPVASTVTHLGVIAKALGPSVTHVKMALYSDLAGSPGTLVAATASTVLVVGDQQIAVTPTPVDAGTYWIMAVYDEVAAIAYSTDDHGAVFKYRAFSFKKSLPTTFGNASQDKGQTFSYYVKVQQ